MLHFLKTHSDNPDFLKLVRELDKDLAIKDGEDHAFYAQFNKVDKIRYVMVVYDQDQAVACGAIKEYDAETMEIKRMFTDPDHRGRGIASQLLKNLEAWASELGFKKCILETGEKQIDAIALYHKNNYRVIPNYGQYAGVDKSICFEKML